MHSWEHYKDVSVRENNTNSVKRRYSVTGDVLSYRRCARLYASLAERGFSPAQPSQRYVGSIIHEVLDRAHLHYSGRLDPRTAGQIPTDDEIKGYFVAVENALRAHGIRPFSPDLSEYVLKILKRFNRIEGPSLYPRVKDTEHRLQNDQGEYILHGVVDVLVSNMGRTEEEEQIEIWDYKGMQRPKLSTKFGRRILRDYTFQMQVYAMLYKLRNGDYPHKAIIYFVGELSDGDPQTAPPSAMMEVPLSVKEIDVALSFFDETVRNIVNSRNTNTWEPPQDGHETAGRETCDACDIRFSCPSEKYPHKFP